MMINPTKEQQHMRKVLYPWLRFTADQDIPVLAKDAPKEAQVLYEVFLAKNYK